MGESSPHYSALVPGQQGLSKVVPGFSYSAFLVMDSLPIVTTVPVGLPASVVSNGAQYMRPYELSAPSVIDGLSTVPRVFTPVQFGVQRDYYEWNSRTTLWVIILPFTEARTVAVLTMPMARTSSDGVWMPSGYSTRVLGALHSSSWLGRTPDL